MATGEMIWNLDIQVQLPAVPHYCGISYVLCGILTLKTGSAGLIYVYSVHLDGM